MQQISIDLGPPHGAVAVRIIRKRIKNVHLRVYPTLEVAVSAPVRVPDRWLRQFLLRHAGWIAGQLAKYQAMERPAASVGDGSAVRLLGRTIQVRCAQARRNAARLEGDCLVLGLRDASDGALAQRVFESWWRETAAQVYQQELDGFFDRIFAPRGLAKPVIKVRRMKTLWGSCAGTKGRVTLNEYLLKADIECVQYVVLHELTHLLYPNHSKAFYDFLTLHMPDWAQRRKRLNAETTLGW